MNRRKQHVLKSRQCLDYYKFVLVPADNAANNVIVVCKKYYLEVELNTTSTYEHIDRDCAHIGTEHLHYMTNNNISVEPMLRHLPKLHKQLSGTMLHPIQSLRLLHVYLKLPLTFKSIVLAFTQEQG